MTESQAFAHVTPQQLVDAALSAVDDDERWGFVVVLHGMGDDEFSPLLERAIAEIDRRSRASGGA